MKKIKLVTIVGTRPEIIRLSACISLSDKHFSHTLVHTGQNYDYELNEIFFEELQIRKPDYFLNVVGENLGHTIGNVISKSYDLLAQLKPDALLVLGDTNSVLSTIAAKRLKIPIFHMEAGNRCFDQNVPEETNRKISDHIADINLSYTEHSRRYLLSEGFRRDHVFVTGSPLREVLNKHRNAIENSNILKSLNLQREKYIVVSLHREENIDIDKNFNRLVESLNGVANKYNLPIIFSTHPRTRNRIKSRSIVFNPLIKNIAPLGFFDYVNLQLNSFIVLSDSGTISEESSIVGFRAVSIRTSTERPEAIDSGSIVLGGITPSQVINSIEISRSFPIEDDEIPVEYCINNTAERVVKIIQGYTQVINEVIWKKN